jgi:IMP and pyridine-specific 5'-nucleotidase
LLAVPFVLNTQPAVEYDGVTGQSLDNMARSAQQRYGEIFRDVEELILDHSEFPAAPVTWDMACC